MVILVVRNDAVAVLIVINLHVQIPRVLVIPEQVRDVHDDLGELGAAPLAHLLQVVEALHVVPRGRLPVGVLPVRRWA